jgi:very-short-patch-repair endonuclease
MGACPMQPEPTIRRARRLRKTPTHAEEFLWTLIRNRQLDGLRFRRQVPIGAYVVDFACLSARLIVEADGGVDDLRTFDDARRDQWLRSQNFTVVRFRNAQIMDRPHEVIAAIRAMARPPSERLRRPPSPARGEGNTTPLPSPLAGEGGSRSETDGGLPGVEENRRLGMPARETAGIQAVATPPSGRLRRPPSPETGEGNQQA